MPFEVGIKDPVTEVLKKMDRPTAEAIVNQIEKLKEHPREYGKPLGGRLHPLWQLRSGHYRIWYTIDGEYVYVRAVYHKDEARKLY